MIPGFQHSFTQRGRDNGFWWYFNLANVDRVSDRNSSVRHQAPENLGGDVGGAIKSFKSAMTEGDKAEEKKTPDSLEKKDSGDANFSEVKADEKSTVEDK